ncbi:MAG: flagellar hook assembly protein FlgD [Candidatus Zixiibacteriota bacterium]|nr:MAG: flagellar hook assembly protein FlgD [candidate division Zixibacteria bacterium]
MTTVAPVSYDVYSKSPNSVPDNILGKEDFLRLLVTQLTHQDPLEPMEDQEFIAQLAQFSSLEQLQNMNSVLGESVQWDYLQMQTINNTMATSLIGKDVKASYNNVYLAETNEPQISFATDRFAQSVRVDIKNAEGFVVRTLTLDDVPPGDLSLKWDGRDGNSNRLESGLYSIEISAYDANGRRFTPATYVTGRVEGVVYRQGAAYLKVNGLEIGLANVEAIMEPDMEDDE